MFGFALVGCTIVIPTPDVPPAADPNAAWRRVIERYINEYDLVDQDGLRRDPSDLDAFVAWIALPDSDVARPVDRQAELAFALNAHTALSVYKEVKGLPINWGSQCVPVFTVRGRPITLRELEESIASGGDLRAMFALGWRDSFARPGSSARLPREPFTAANVDRLLDAMMREFVDDRRNVEVHSSGTKVRLAKWFLDHADDIRAHAPDPLAFCNLYRSTPLPNGTVEYRNY
jgi:hypothetical protein